MTLPTWILRRFVEPGGVRLPKRAEPSPDIAGTCPTCHQPVIRKMMMSVLQVDGIFKNGIYYHYGCQPYKQMDPWYTDQEQRDGVQKEISGNLDQEEYRYWIGEPETWKVNAICRCCRRETFSKLERLDHFRDADYIVGTNQCSTRVVLAYKRLLDYPSCLICKRQRFNNTKWGVPLCDSPSCINSWKFDHEARYIILKHELQLQENRAKAIGEEKQTVRVYCQQCHMFQDNAGHDEVHSAILESHRRGYMH